MKAKVKTTIWNNIDKLRDSFFKIIVINFIFWLIVGIQAFILKVYAIIGLASIQIFMCYIIVISKFKWDKNEQFINGQKK